MVSELILELQGKMKEKGLKDKKQFLKKKRQKLLHQLTKLNDKQLSTFHSTSREMENTYRRSDQ